MEEIKVINTSSLGIFEEECNELLSKGYIVSSTSSAWSESFGCNCYIAILIKKPLEVPANAE